MRIGQPLDLKQLSMQGFDIAAQFDNSCHGSRKPSGCDRDRHGRYCLQAGDFVLNVAHVSVNRLVNSINTMIRGGCEAGRLGFDRRLKIIKSPTINIGHLTGLIDDGLLHPTKVSMKIGPQPVDIGAYHAGTGSLCSCEQIKRVVSNNFKARF